MPFLKICIENLLRIAILRKICLCLTVWYPPILTNLLINCHILTVATCGSEYVIDDKFYDN